MGLIIELVRDYVWVSLKHQGKEIGVVRVSHGSHDRKVKLEFNLIESIEINRVYEDVSRNMYVDEGRN
jgi:hypothetical protein